LSASPTWARAELFPEEHYILNRPSSTGTPEGPIIEIAGRVIDGNGDPVPDAMVEIWQANAAGRYASPDDTREDCALDPHFVGFGRAATSAEGIYRFRTIRPGRVLGPGNRLQARMWLFRYSGGAWSSASRPGSILPIARTTMSMPCRHECLSSGGTP
jgi:protocatechuate 3,4-dioxygenase alpha subunit